MGINKVKVGQYKTVCRTETGVYLPSKTQSKTWLNRRYENDNELKNTISDFEFKPTKKYVLMGKGDGTPCTVGVQRNFLFGVKKIGFQMEQRPDKTPKHHQSPQKRLS